MAFSIALNHFIQPSSKRSSTVFMIFFDSECDFLLNKSLKLSEINS